MNNVVLSSRAEKLLKKSFKSKSISIFFDSFDKKNHPFSIAQLLEYKFFKILNDKKVPSLKKIENGFFFSELISFKITKNGKRYFKSLKNSFY